MERPAEHHHRVRRRIPGDQLNAGTAAVAWILVATFGAVIGSFLNVVIWRVPRGESIVRPPSACPTCGARIRARDNIPVLSWLLLRGRCRDCSEPISRRYPAVELLTAVLFVLVVLRFVGGSSLAPVPAYWYLAAIGVTLSLIDLDTHRLPNAIILPSYPVVAVLLTLASWGAGDWDALLRALIGGAVLFALYLLLCVVKPGGMGFGDVKLAGIVGAGLAWIGWGTLAVGGFVAFLLGGIYGAALILAHRAGRKSKVPFGPWIVLGAVVGLAFGEALWAGYLDMIL